MDLNKNLSWKSNYVELIGKLYDSSIKYFGEEYPRFQGKISVPMEYNYDELDGIKTSTYFKIVAWGDVAEALNEVGDGKIVLINGVLQERQYDGFCKGCGSKEKKYWSDVLITNFVVM